MRRPCRGHGDRKKQAESTNDTTSQSFSWGLSTDVTVPAD